MPYDDSWDTPHPPGDQENWQESDCYWFYDAASGVGGYHRIGQFVNQCAGQVLLFVFERGGQRFRLICDYDGAALSRTATGQRIGSSSVEAPGSGVMLYAWSEDECAGSLRFEAPFYTPRSWLKDERSDAGASAVAGKMNTDGHLEVSGRIRGTITLGTRVVTIDALAHRDRSWGARDYASAHQHRMVTGTLGPALSWATFIIHLDNGMIAKAGFVARDGETIDIRDIQVLTEFDQDGLTVAGLRSRLHLKDGSHVDIDGAALEGCTFVTQDWLVSSHHFIALAVDGFTILDTTNRPSKGSYLPVPGELTAVCGVDGLSGAGDYAAFHKEPSPIIAPS